jgi:hypothetical protein
MGDGRFWIELLVPKVFQAHFEFDHLPLIDLNLPSQVHKARGGRVDIRYGVAAAPLDRLACIPRIRQMRLEIFSCSRSFCGST